MDNYLENYLMSGLTIMLWGLSLMMLWLTLTIKSIKRIWIPGAIITFIGILIFFLSIMFLGPTTQSGMNLFFIGASVFSLGVLTILQALGKGNEKTIKIGSWSVTGFGFVIVLITLIVCCVSTHAR